MWTVNEMGSEQLIDETRVRIDKTSQLLVTMAITVSELIKRAYKRAGYQTARSEDFKIK